MTRKCGRRSSDIELHRWEKIFTAEHAELRRGEKYNAFAVSGASQYDKYFVFLSALRDLRGEKKCTNITSVECGGI